MSPQAAAVPVVECATCENQWLAEDLDPFREAGVRVCPKCLGTNVRDASVAGAGTVRTFAWYLEPLWPELRQTPYNIAVVELDAGLRIMAGVEDVGYGDLEIGRRVAATWRTENGTDVLRFV